MFPSLNRMFAMNGWKKDEISSAPNATGPVKPTSATFQLLDDTSAPVEEKHFVPLSAKLT